jgi:hypothetical protein
MSSQSLEANRLTALIEGNRMGNGQVPRGVRLEAVRYMRARRRNDPALSNEAIAKEIGVTGPTVAYWLKNVPDLAPVPDELPFEDELATKEPPKDEPPEEAWAEEREEGFDLGPFVLARDERGYSVSGLSPRQLVKVLEVLW